MNSSQTAMKSVKDGAVAVQSVQEGEGSAFAKESELASASLAQHENTTSLRVSSACMLTVNFY